AVRYVLALIVTVTLAAPSFAQLLKEVGVEVLKTVGAKLVGKGFDYLWGKEIAPDQRVAELQERLSAYESGLRQVDAKLADQIAALRKALNPRPPADEVRKIVNQPLKSLEDRTTNLENRQDLLDSRVRQIEELFGYIPTVTPAPLLVSSVEAG